MIRTLSETEAGALLAHRAARFTEAERIVEPILEDVRTRGDAALLEYARRFDGFEGSSVVETSRAPMPARLRGAVRTAAANIRRYAKRQVPKPWSAVFPGGY